MSYTPIQHLKAENSAPSFDAAAVTPSDDNNITMCRALYVGTGGNIKVVTAAGSTVTFVNVPGGAILPVYASKVFATDTTALNIVALY